MNKMAKKNSQELFNVFITRTGNIAKQWGLGEPAGRVWATLLFAEKPLSQKEIAEKTGYSLSLVSPSLKILEGLNMVRKKRGDGKEKLYELTASFIETFHLMIRRFLEVEIKPLVEMLNEHIETDKSNKKLVQLSKEYQRLETQLHWFDKLNGLKKMTSEQIKKIVK